ncbi:amidase family protein [Bosea sp. 117]|uniref:amidase family protein n=1 Tax=Bosea sp. 117 TaxID=1125973 RepID=UPI000A471DB7|nr:amidase family protein [Bosea sp. 117]
MMDAPAAARTPLEIREAPLLHAATLAGEIRAGRLTPADLAERCIATIEAHEADVAAFAAFDAEALRAQARLPGLAELPLAGLPVGVKDIIDTADLPTGRGSPVFAGHRPASDATVVRMTRRAGGIIAGKTATTELAFMQPAATRNPRRLAHSPGGSSAGSAAAVAAGMLPIAVGTQTAGSVIRPAAYCGVTGYKPSFKLIPTVGVKPFAWSLDTVGLFAARVADAAFAASAITGRDLQLDEAASAPRIALVFTARADQASPAARLALEEAASAAARAGARMKTLMLPDEVETGDDTHAVIQAFEAAHALADEWDRHRDRLSPQLSAYLDDARNVTPDAYDAARRAARRARHALADATRDFDAVLTFAATGEAPEGHASTGSPVFNRLWTLMGSPCVNVAGLSGPTGLPIGVQLVGRFGRDRALLAAAAFLERAIVER